MNLLHRNLTVPVTKNYLNCRFAESLLKIRLGTGYHCDKAGTPKIIEEAYIRNRPPLRLVVLGIFINICVYKCLEKYDPPYLPISNGSCCSSVSRLGLMIFRYPPNKTFVFVKLIVSADSFESFLDICRNGFLTQHMFTCREHFQYDSWLNTNRKGHEDARDILPCQ